MRRSMACAAEGTLIGIDVMVQCGIGKDVGNKWAVDLEIDIDDTRSCGFEMLGMMARYEVVVCRSG